jgi:hypothetical protein
MTTYVAVRDESIDPPPGPIAIIITVLSVVVVAAILWFVLTGPETVTTDMNQSAIGQTAVGPKAKPADAPRDEAVADAELGRPDDETSGQDTRASASSTQSSPAATQTRQQRTDSVGSNY